MTDGAVTPGSTAPAMAMESQSPSGDPLPCGAGLGGTVLGGYDIGQQVGFLLRQAHQRHVALFQGAMPELDLTPTQFNALIRVVEAGAVGQNQLGRLSAMDPPTIQGVVRRLQERGLVQAA